MMPGFTNVSNMTSRQIQRMGHADDSTPYRAKTRTQKVTVNYNADDVWGAACAAQRINGSYVKETQYRFDEDKNTTVVVKQRNRDVMESILANPALLTVEDIAQGQECRKYLQNDITFRALKSKLNDFDTATSKVLAVTESFDTVKNKYELAVVAALPGSYEKAVAREAVQERVRETSGEFVGNPGDKVTLNVEIIRTNFSKTWNIWFATAITADNQAVFFSFKQPFDAGTQLTIKGTVKAHKDGQTQLNRVSVL
jgi:hypothetical protein